MQAKQKDVKNGCRADQAVAPKDSKVQTIIDLLKGHSNASINLEAAFAGKSGGIPVHQHKFRQTLFGSAGSKPRLLKLHAKSKRLDLIKRDTPNAKSGAENKKYSIDVSEITNMTIGAKTDVFKKSLGKRGLKSVALSEADRRCFTINFRDKTYWNLEIDVMSNMELPGTSQSLDQILGEQLRTLLSDFLVAAADNASRSKKGMSMDAASIENRKKTFRQRKLSITGKDGEFSNMIDDIVKEVEAADGDLYMSRELVGKGGVGKAGLASDRSLPFSASKCGTYSCHGIEPKFTRQGFSIKAKINQDRGGIQYPFGGRKDMAFICVMDGHGRGGERISEYCMQNLPSLLLEHPAFLDADYEKALRESVLQVDKNLRVKLGREATYAGTTMVLVLAVADTLYIANAGDSRAVVGSLSSTNRNNIIAKNLSNDHKPDSSEEKRRILSMGGFVSPESEEDGPARVWLGRSMNSCGLSMARSLGDHALAAVGVIAEPEITTHQLTSTDRYLILGSDGIWEFISSQAACDIVHTIMSKAKSDSDAADQACRALIEKSSLLWKQNEHDYRDDITGTVLRLPIY